MIPAIMAIVMISMTGIAVHDMLQPEPPKYYFENGHWVRVGEE